MERAHDLLMLYAGKVWTLSGRGGVQELGGEEGDLSSLWDLEKFQELITDDTVPIAGLSGIIKDVGTRVCGCLPIQRACFKTPISRNRESTQQTTEKWWSVETMWDGRLGAGEGGSRIISDGNNKLNSWQSCPWNVLSNLNPLITLWLVLL